MNKRLNGKRLPVGGRDWNVLDKLLTPTIHWKPVTVKGRTFCVPIVLRTLEQNVERYRKLWDQG